MRRRDFGLAAAVAITSGVFVASVSHGWPLQVYPANGDERTLMSYSQYGLVLQTVLVSGSELTQAAAEAIARRHLEIARGAPFAEIIIGPNEKDLRVSSTGSPAVPETEDNFCRTRQAIGAPLRLPASAAARLLVMQGAAKFSYRHAGSPRVGTDGVTSKLLDGAGDPTEFSSREGSYELLHVTVKRGSSSDFSGIAFFKGTAIPSCAACDELERSVESHIGGRDWEVQARRDTWFSSEFFPLVFRFERDDAEVVYQNSAGFLTAPTVPEYYRGSHVICRRYYGKFTCAAYGRYDRVE